MESADIFAAITKFVSENVLYLLLAILVLTGGILMGADRVLARLGNSGLRIIEKLMGLLLTVIAVQLIIDGAEPVVRRMLA